MEKKTSLFENGLIWFGAGVSIGVISGVSTGVGVTVTPGISAAMAGTLNAIHAAHTASHFVILFIFFVLLVQSGQKSINSSFLFLVSCLIWYSRLIASSFVEKPS